MIDLITYLLVLSEKEVIGYSPRTTNYPVIHLSRKLLLVKGLTPQGGEGTIAQSIS